MAPPNLFRLIFPDEPREFPGRRWLKILLRGIHALSAGVLVGAYLFDVASDPRHAWLAAALASGVALLLLDLHETAVFLVQFRGVVVICKLAVLAALPWLGAWQGWALGALVVISVVSSHAPAKVRYLILLRANRLHGSESRG